jgi:hypothetical protein
MTMPDKFKFSHTVDICENVDDFIKKTFIILTLNKQCMNFFRSLMHMQTTKI